MIATLAAASLLAIQSANYARAIAVSPNGQTVAVGGWSQSVDFFRADGTFSTRLGPFNAHVTGLAWDRAGRRVAISVADGTVGLWDVASTKWVWRKNSGTSFASGVAVLANGDVVSSGYDNRLKRWAGADGKAIRTFNGLPSDAYGMTASNDGRQVLGFGPDGANLWDANTGRSLGTLRMKNNFGGAAFLSNDGLIAIMGLDGKVVVTNRTLKASDTLEWNASAIAASNAQMLMAVGTRKGEVVYYRMDILDAYWATEAQGSEVTAVTVSRDGTRVWAAYQDGTVRGWRGSDGKLTASMTIPTS